MNDHLLHRSPCSTDSNRKPAPSPTQRVKAATGVTRSATTSNHTGTTEWSAASLRKSSLLGLSIEPGPADLPVEAAVLTGVAGALALLVDDEQQHVAVAVVPGFADPLPIAGGVALAPLLLPAPAPEHGAALLQRAPQGGLVHPRHHQHLAGRLLLHDRRHQPVAV